MQIATVVLMIVGWQSVTTPPQAPDSPAAPVAAPAQTLPAAPPEVVKSLVGRWRIDVDKTREHLRAHLPEDEPARSIHEREMAMLPLAGSTLSIDLTADGSALWVTSSVPKPDRWSVRDGRVVLDSWTAQPGQRPAPSLSIEGSTLLYAQDGRPNQAVVMTRSDFGPTPTIDDIVGEWLPKTDGLAERWKALYKNASLPPGTNVDETIDSMIAALRSARVSIKRDNTVLGAVGSAERPFSIQRDWLLIGDLKSNHRMDKSVMRWDGQNLILEASMMTPGPITLERVRKP